MEQGREGSQGAGRGNQGLEWRRWMEGKNPRSEIPPSKQHSSPCASGSETPLPCATDGDSSHPSVGDSRYSQRPVEEVLREMQQRREKRERRKKRLRDKKQRRKKEEQLRDLQRSAASASGGIEADVHASHTHTSSGLPDSTIIEPAAGEEALPPRVEAGEVGSNELDPTIEDISSLETLWLNDSFSALDSTIRADVHASHTGSGLPDSTIIEREAGEEALPPSVEAGEVGINELDPTIEDISSLEILSLNDSFSALDSTIGTAKLHELQEYLNEHTFDTIDDFFDFICNNNDNAEDQVVYEQLSLDELESEPVPEPNQVLPVLQSEEAQSVARPGQYSKGSKEEIAQNANKWMTEEVMVAFQKYRERKDDLKECEYELDELCNQCFNVQDYNHIFHHFNFTMKMKTAGSTDWISVLYFAEVKEIFGRKIYFCCPLEPGENGHCYACKNQKIDDLKHPIIGPFERGNQDSVFPFTYDSSSCPFTYDSSSSDDDDDDPKEVHDEAWRMRMRAAGVMVG